MNLLEQQGKVGDGHYSTQPLVIQHLDINVG